MEKIMKIEGMRCMGCANAVSKAIVSVKGVRKAEVDLAQGSAIIIFDEKISSWDEIKNRVIKAGYKVVD
ncbi:MAG TPA: heavy-metal-associated domain-containing protein [Firmicutes bacterium]|jgi:copper chaperone CopZ|nr:heavy-metal-associated domain-containing protein [Bacillota bacterium]